LEVSDQAAIVTGAASGLGLATARKLAKAGACVAVFDLDTEAGKKVAEEIGGVFARVDLADEASAIEGFELAKASHGSARILVNCAGIGGPPIRTAGQRGPYHSMYSERSWT